MYLKGRHISHHLVYLHLTGPVVCFSELVCEVKGLIFHWLKGSRTPHKLVMSESDSFSQTHNLSAVCVPVYALAFYLNVKSMFT